MRGFYVWLGAAVVGLFFWLVPAQLGAIRDEHIKIMTTLQVMCVHDSVTEKERRECIRGELEDGKDLSYSKVR